MTNLITGLHCPTLVRMSKALLAATDKQDKHFTHNRIVILEINVFAYAVYIANTEIQQSNILQLLLTSFVNLYL